MGNFAGSCIVSRVRVLVVDDSSVVRARLVAMIREVRGVVVVDEARDAREALEVSRANPPDLVVLDIHMPGASGTAILPLLKALPTAPLVAVLTNDPHEAHRRECLLGGADFFFDKAKEFERVLEVIAEPESARAAGGATTRRP